MGDATAAYFDGLPDAAGNFSGPLCAAADDLTLPTGNPLEASTAAALGFLDSVDGTCPAPLAAAPALRTSLLRASAGAVNPTAADLTPAQRDVAGLC